MLGFRGHLNQKGDTIVEVLIAMAVASLVLGSAYAVANHSMKNSRQAQEHSEALQIAQKQLEAIVSAVTDDAKVHDLEDSTIKYKCLSDVDESVVKQPSLQTVGSDPSNYAAACRDLGVGSGGYRTAVEYVVPAAQIPKIDPYYRVYVTWPSITGNGDDQVSLSYRALR